MCMFSNLPDIKTCDALVCVFAHVFAAREAAMWELEERHLQEKHQQLKQQLKDQYFMQRHQLLKRHEKVSVEISTQRMCNHFLTKLNSKTL